VKVSFWNETGCLFGQAAVFESIDLGPESVGSNSALPLVSRIMIEGNHLNFGGLSFLTCKMKIKIVPI
jgi:hypothetical protein